MNKEQLDLTLKLAVDEGISLRESTKEALQELTNPHYTVTLAGCFQVGKSTLLNKVMLGSDMLLTEGKGLPTTAIPTIPRRKTSCASPLSWWPASPPLWPMPTL